MSNPVPATRSCRSAGRNVSARAFTLTELLTVIAIIGVLAAIIFPTVGKIRQAGQKSACASNLRQIGLALENYSAENRGALPGYDIIKDNTSANAYYGLNRAAGPTYWFEGGQPTRDLVSHLIPYLGNRGTTSTGVSPLFVCAAAASAKGSTATFTSYYISTGVMTTAGVIRRPIGYNGSRSIKRLEIANPARAVALFDADNEFLGLISQSAVNGAVDTAAHGATRNVLYFDGHVGSIEKHINPHERL